MLPPAIATTAQTVETAAPEPAGSPLSTPAGSAAAGGFSLSLEAASGAGAIGTGLPVAGNELPLPPATALAAVPVPAPADITLAASRESGEPSLPAAEVAGEAGLAALELILPPAPRDPAVAAAAAAGPATAPAGANAPAVVRAAPVRSAGTGGGSPAELPKVMTAGLVAPLPTDSRPADLPEVPAAEVQIRDTAGRNEFALADVLKFASRRERAAAALPAGGDGLRRVDALSRSMPATEPLSPAALPLPAHGALAAVAPAATLAPSPASALPALPLPVDSAGWGDALAERVVVMAGQKLQSADIRLNPAELGPLRVEIRIEDGAAQVSFQAQQAVTREAIEQALPRLRELFAAEGLALTDASVGEQGLREGGGSAAGQADEASAAAADAAGDEPSSGDPDSRGRAVKGLVDTFA